MREALPAADRQGYWMGELNFRHFRTGEMIPVLYSVFPITDANGAFIDYGTVTRDFRDRRRAEDDMRLMNGELATRALSPHGAIGERILLSGPEVTLKPELTVAFALALHELATNAAKYGALSNDVGTVTLAWMIEGDGNDALISVCWREQGGPRVSTPSERGLARF